MKIKKKILIQATAMIMALSLPLTTVAQAEDKQTRATTTPIEINETNFPDDTFREHFINNFDTDANGSLSEEEVKAVNELNVTYEDSITSLQGIEYFTELTSLNAYDTPLTSLDITKNTKLTSLNIGSIMGGFVTLSTLDVSQNTALVSLIVYGCEFLKTLDVSNNTALTSLDCHNSNLTKLDLSNNTALEELDCQYNQLISLDLSKQTSLTSLNCDNNKLVSLHLPKDVIFTDLNISNQVAEIRLDSETSDEFDLQTVDSKIDGSKISNLTSGVAINGTVLSGLKKGAQLQYTYDCGAGQSLTVPLVVRVKDIYSVVVNNGTGSKDYRVGETVRIKAENQESIGLFFEKWRINSYESILTDATSEETTFIMPSFDVEVSAEYAWAKYPLVVNSGIGSGDYQLYDYVTIEADAPVEGKQFKEWQVVSGGITLANPNDATTNFTMPAGRVEVTAIYEDILYPVVVNGGTGSNDHIMNDVVTITANEPDVGKQFKEWQVVSGGITLANPNDATTTFTMPASNVEVTAVYEEATYSVVVNGSIDSKEYKENETVTIKANEPAVGKQFKEWQVVSGGITLANPNDATTTFTMPAGNVEVTAVYEDILYPVVVNGGTGSNDYIMNDVVTIKADKPAIGKQFKEWQVISGSVTLDNPKSTTTTFTMPVGNVEVTAVYEDVTITGSSSDSTYQIGSGKNLIYRCSSLLEDFVGIYMDNELIDASHYTLKSGSTIVTLESSYLDTLTVGKHTIRFEYKDGVIAETELTIKAKEAEIKPEDKPNNPTTPDDKINTPSDEVKTGDETNIGVLTTLLAFTGVALLVTIRKRYLYK